MKLVKEGKSCAMGRGDSVESVEGGRWSKTGGWVGSGLAREACRVVPYSFWIQFETNPRHVLLVIICGPEVRCLNYGHPNISFQQISFACLINDQRSRNLSKQNWLNRQASIAQFPQIGSKCIGIVRNSWEYLWVWSSMRGQECTSGKHTLRNPVNRTKYTSGSWIHASI